MLTTRGQSYRGSSRHDGSSRARDWLKRLWVLTRGFFLYVRVCACRCQACQCGSADSWSPWAVYLPGPSPCWPACWCRQSQSSPPTRQPSPSSCPSCQRWYDTHSLTHLQLEASKRSEENWNEIQSWLAEALINHVKNASNIKGLPFSVGCIRHVISLISQEYNYFPAFVTLRTLVSLANSM